MGIMVWHCRDNKEELVSDMPYFQCELKNGDGKTMGLIVSDIDCEIELLNQENLLQKIAGSLNSAENKITQKCGRKPVCESTMNFVLLISLADLLKNPENKKKLWEEMKLLKIYF